MSRYVAVGSDVLQIRKHERIASQFIVTSGCRKNEEDSDMQEWGVKGGVLGVDGRGERNERNGMYERDEVKYGENGEKYKENHSNYQNSVNNSSNKNHREVMLTEHNNNPIGRSIFHVDQKEEDEEIQKVFKMAGGVVRKALKNVKNNDDALTGDDKLFMMNNNNSNYNTSSNCNRNSNNSNNSNNNNSNNSNNTNTITCNDDKTPMGSSTITHPSGLSGSAQDDMPLDLHSIRFLFEVHFLLLFFLLFFFYFC